MSILLMTMTLTFIYLQYLLYRIGIFLQLWRSPPIKPPRRRPRRGDRVDGSRILADVCLCIKERRPYSLPVLFVNTRQRERWCTVLSAHLGDRNFQIFVFINTTGFTWSVFKLFPSMNNFLMKRDTCYYFFANNIFRMYILYETNDIRNEYFVRYEYIRNE